MTQQEVRACFGRVPWLVHPCAACCVVGQVSGGGMSQLAEDKVRLSCRNTRRSGCWLYERAGGWCLSRSLSATAPCTLASPNPNRVLLPQTLPQRRWRHFRADAAADVRIRCLGTPVPACPRCILQAYAWQPQVASKTTQLPPRLLPLLWPSTVFNRLQHVRRGGQLIALLAPWAV